MDPPEAVVIDVGLAELFPPSEAESFKSADAAGTLATMAPEVIRGSFNATRFTGGLALSPAFAGFGAGFWDGFRAGAWNWTARMAFSWFLLVFFFFDVF